MSDSGFKEQERDRTRKRAARIHHGPGLWHVEKRGGSIICRACQARIPAWKNPAHRPSAARGEASPPR